MPMFMPHAFPPHGFMPHFMPYGMPYEVPMRGRYHCRPCYSPCAPLAAVFLAFLFLSALPVLVSAFALAIKMLFSFIAVAINIAFWIFVCNAVASVVHSIASTMCDDDEDCSRTAKTEACFKRCAFAKMCANMKACHAKRTASKQCHTKPATATTKQYETEEVHPGVVCDRSGMSPIVGPRFHLRGHDYDLCEAEFAKLGAREQALYQRVPAPAYRRVASPSAKPSAPPSASPSTSPPASARAAPAAETPAEPAAPPAAPATKESSRAPGRARRVDLSSVTRVDATDSAVTVVVAAPGVAPADLDVRVLGKVLKITGATARGAETFSVERSLGLPANVVPESAQATHAHGEVTVVIQRDAGTRIPVRAAAVAVEAPQAPAAAATEQAVHEPAGHEQQRDAPAEADEDPQAEATAAAEEVAPKAESSEDEWVPLATEDKKVQ